MTPAFIAAVVDTLLPGEETALPHARRLPSGSALGLAEAPYVRAFHPLLQAVAEHGAGAEHFIAAGAEERLAVVDAVDRQTGGRVRAFAMALLQDYCESPQVLEAMATPTDPPQPRGRELVPADAATLALLERVRARGPVWR